MTATLASTRPEPAHRPRKTTSRRLKDVGKTTFRALNALVILFLGWDTAMKLFLISQAVEGTEELGYPVSVLFGIGLVELLCLVIYVMPRTALLGAILWTGYLGGAIASHVRVDNPLFSHVLFPLYIAVFLWGDVWLRNENLRKLLPFVRRGDTPAELNGHHRIV